MSNIKQTDEVEERAQKAETDFVHALHVLILAHADRLKRDRNAPPVEAVDEGMGYAAFIICHALAQSIIVRDVPGENEEPLSARGRHALQVQTLALLSEIMSDATRRVKPNMVSDMIDQATALTQALGQHRKTCPDCGTPHNKKMSS